MVPHRITFWSYTFEMLSLNHQSMSDTQRHCYLLINQMLQLDPSGKVYVFYGHSFSQKKTQTCYMIDNKHIPSFPLLPNEISLKRSKCAKYSGLWFTGLKLQHKVKECFVLICVLILIDVEIAYEHDIMDKEKRKFTDGCGIISSALLCRIKFPTDVKPSVIQVRYPGVKGILIKEVSEKQYVRFRIP